MDHATFCRMLMPFQSKRVNQTHMVTEYTYSVEVDLCIGKGLRIEKTFNAYNHVTAAESQRCPDSCSKVWLIATLDSAVRDTVRFVASVVPQSHTPIVL